MEPKRRKRWLIVMHNGEVLISCSPPVLLLLLLLCDVELYSAEKILCFAQTKRLYLFYHVQMFVCVLDLGDDFVIFNVLKSAKCAKSAWILFKRRAHKNTKHKFRGNIGSVVMSLLLALLPYLYVCHHNCSSFLLPLHDLCWWGKKIEEEWGGMCFL